MFGLATAPYQTVRLLQLNLTALLMVLSTLSSVCSIVCMHVCVSVCECVSVMCVCLSLSLSLAVSLCRSLCLSVCAYTRAHADTSVALRKWRKASGRGLCVGRRQLTDLDADVTDALPDLIGVHAIMVSEVLPQGLKAPLVALAHTHVVVLDKRVALLVDAVVGEVHVPVSQL